MTARERSALLIRVVCLAGAVLWMALTAADRGLLERLEFAALDTELRVAPAPRASNEIVIVALDERAVHRYGPLRWPPERMAEIVEALDRAGASVIAFDFVFSAETEGRAQAQRQDLAPLAAAVRRSGNVVLGTYFDFDDDPEPHPLSPASDIREHRVRSMRYVGGASPARDAAPPAPVASEAHTLAPELEKAARGYGHLNLLPNSDGIIRWMPLVARFEGDLYANFAVEVAAAFLYRPRTGAAPGAPAGSPGELQPELLIGRQRIEGLRLGARQIVTDEHGRLLVRFAGRRGTYRTFSAADLLAGQIPAGELRGRIALVGSTAAGAADVWATPLDPLLPGVEIHANTIDNLLAGDFLVRNWLTRLLTFALLAFAGVAGALILPWALRFGMRRVGIGAGLFVLAFLAGHDLLVTRTGYTVAVVSPLLAMTTILGGTLVAGYFTAEKQRAQVERSFEHYLDRSVITELLERPERLRLGGERRELTVLFCDIRNFTTVAEGLPPETTVEMLNDFFTTMTGVVFAHGGLVDKFVGDQIMAVWGAPLQRDDHAAAACAAALEMIRAFGALQKRWAGLPICPWDPSGSGNAEAHATIRCGIGINSGPMVVGNIGSAKRFSYTVIGDNVNVASRLEALNKLYGTQILAGPNAYEAARGEFRFREIDQVRVRGRSQSLTVYELVGREGDGSPDEEWLAAFAEGLAAYRQQQWTAAASAFGAALDRNPLDACAKFYLSRAEECAKNPPQREREGALYLR